MKIGILVDGEAERAGLPMLFEQLRAQTGHAIVNPLQPAVHPKADPERFAGACVPKIEILAKKGVDRIVVLVDREDRDDCPTEIATAIRQSIIRKTALPVCVVVKDRCFENWLVADAESFVSSTRFKLEPSVRRAIESGLADGLDALALLKRNAVKDSYNKVRDGKRILEQSDVGRMAAGSRSFRRLLRCLGHPQYLDGSKRPASTGSSGQAAG
jgi:hypothetical protein